MKYRSIKVLLTALLIVAGLTVSAQSAHGEQKRVSKGGVNSDIKVSTEFGLGIGARYNLFYVTPLCEDFSPSISTKLSYGAALQFRVNIGKVFGVQPEISYAYANVHINDEKHNFSRKIKYSTVQIPLLLSIKAAMFRFNAGPVFTLMDSPTYTLEKTVDGTTTTQQHFLGKLFPTVTYAAGISVKFAGCMMIDLRYADQFRNIKATNAYLYTLDEVQQPKAQEFRTRTRSIQLRFGYVF